MIDAGSGVDAATDAAFAAPTDVAAPSTPDAGPPMHAIDAGFFGMHLNKYGSALTFGSERVWDAGVSWYALQTGPTTFDWSQLDCRMGKAKQYGFDVLYTFGHTHLSITKNKNNSADPPIDVNPDGSGTDAYVKAFWTAFMAHDVHDSGAKTCDPIRHFEMWNEPNGRAMHELDLPDDIARGRRVVHEVVGPHRRVARNHGPSGTHQNRIRPGHARHSLGGRAHHVSRKPACFASSLHGTIVADCV